jgi:hypothetical protein
MTTFTDPSARTVLKYIVSCALPAGAHIDLNVGGTVYGYDGQIGLAPEWGLDGGSCDATCQAWVSGCVISRINYAGHVVPISVRGAELGGTPASEMSTYSSPDAVFYGNIFTWPQVRYACLPPNGELTRTCGQGNPLATCVGVTYLGPCTSLCGNVAADGSYQNCTDGAGTAYPGSISIFLQPGQPIP